MKTVLDFTLFTLSHAKKDSVPEGAMLPIPVAEVGSAGEWEYLFGTTGHKITKTLLNTKFTSYYEKNGWTRAAYDAVTAGWIGRVACDCQGLHDKFCGIDINADMHYKTCTETGEVKAADHYEIGECMFIDKGGKKTHVGWVVGYTPDGDEIIVEERGIRYGCVLTKRSERPWTHHGKSTQYLDYSEPVALYTPEPVTFKVGDSGGDVVALQTFLAGMNYCDQNGKPLEIDGKLGPKTWYALTSFADAHVEAAEGVDIEAVGMLTLDRAGKYTIFASRTDDLPKEV